ncbi:MAG: CynX/NimT family MFS transporter [SAR324 cluster bacterium]
MAIPALTNRWVVLALLFFARLVMALQFQSVPPLAPFLAHDLGLTFGQIGTLIGVYMFPGVLLALPGGLLGQRIGDKRAVLVSLALQTLGALLFAFATSFPVALVGRLLGGVGVVMLNVQMIKMTTDWFAGREISTAMGIALSAWPLGIALALSTLGVVALATSWHVAVLLTAVCSALSLALVALLYRDPPAAGAGALSRRLWAISRAELALIAVAGVVWMLANAGYIVFVGFAPALLIQRGIPVSAAGFLVGLASWISIGSVPLGGWLADRLGRLDLFIVAGILANVVAILLLSTGHAVALWLVVFGLALGLSPSAIMTLPAQVLSPLGRGTGFGVYYTIYYAGMAVFPPLAGRLVDTAHDARAALYLAAALMGMTCVALVVLRMMQRVLRLRGVPGVA